LVLLLHSRRVPDRDDLQLVLSGTITTAGSTAQGMIGVAAIGLIYFITVFGNYHYRLNLEASQFEMEVTFKPEDKTPSPPESAHLVRAIDDGLFLVFKDAPDGSSS
jgi:hypothetical protein